VLQLDLWISGGAFQILPCLVLSVFTGLLVRFLREAKRNKDRIFTSRAGGTHENASGSRDRTTTALVAIDLVVLVTEFPIAVLSVLIGISSAELVRRVYVPLEDILDDILVLATNTTFVIYCVMSSQFRRVR
jgi:hypothetical protein